MMVKKVFTNFIKDRFLLICFYMFSLLCIITFFYVSEPLKTEVLYPFSIGVFLLVIYLVIDWFRYFRTNYSIEQMLRNEFVEIEPQTEEQKAFHLLLQKILRDQKEKYYELKEQNEERMYFFSHWLHHLKTPVSVIELIINNKKQSGETDDVYSEILQENRRIYNSIEQALTMLRIEKFENDLEVTSVDLLQSLRKLINQRKKEFIFQSIFPTIDFQGHDAYVVTDTKWNEILLDQIISNAMKYSSTKQGNKKLIFHIEKNDKYITLSVVDEGVGIPPYDLERLFQPFFTGENGRKFPNSTGIGLYLCKKIADKLGQTITIHSEVGVGTTVKIRWLTGSKLGE